MAETRWITSQQVARAFGVSDFIARALLRRGEIPGGCLLPGGRWLCDAAAFELWAAGRKFPVRVKPDPSVIYFVQREGDVHAPVKIGVSTEGGLKLRLKAIQTGYPHKLAVLAAMPGDAFDEKRLHDSFAHARLNGEWFEPTPALLALIEGLS